MFGQNSSDIQRTINFDNYLCFKSFLTFEETFQQNIIFQVLAKSVVHLRSKLIIYFINLVKNHSNSSDNRENIKDININVKQF